MEMIIFCKLVQWKLICVLFISCRYGADPNAKTISLTEGTSYSDTPLHLASRHNHAFCIKRLVQAGGNLWAKNCLGLLPVQFVNDCKLQEWMDHMQQNPRTLQLQSVAIVRKHLKPNRTKNVLKLPLPSHLARLVLFEAQPKIL